MTICIVLQTNPRNILYGTCIPYVILGLHYKVEVTVYSVRFLISGILRSSIKHVDPDINITELYIL